MPNVIHHTEECRQQSIEAEVWALRWPKHCRSCMGAGYHEDPGVRYHGDGSGTPPSETPCSCIEQGLCPRCSSEMWAVERADRNDYLRCPACGWDEWLLFNPDSTLEPKVIVSGFISPEQDGPCWCELEAMAQLETRLYEAAMDDQDNHL